MFEVNPALHKKNEIREGGDDSKGDDGGDDNGQ